MEYAAPLNKLIYHFSHIFTENLSGVIGSDLSDDLQALADLRNLFAHGRDLTMDFEGDDLRDLKVNLDGNQLKKAALCLRRVGIMKHYEINRKNYHEFQEEFYSDAAMRHFYKAVQAIELKLMTFSPFLPEKQFPMPPPLPPLNS